MPGKKTFVLDTSFLADYPHAIYAFDDNDVCIADVTLEDSECVRSPLAREAVRLMCLKGQARAHDYCPGTRLTVKPT